MLGMSKAVVGLDVGSYAVKAVALQPNKDRLVLQGYAQARIGTQDPAVVIRKVLEDLDVKPRNLVTSVSGRSVIVRQVETPRLGPDELKAHIAYEADKYIPFGSDEVIIDCQPLPDRGEAKASNMQVLLVAVRRGFVEDHIALLRSAGVSPSVIDVDVFALSNAFELLGPGSDPGAPDTPTNALIDIGASKSNIAIVQGNRLLFTREVYLAGNEITDAIVRTFNEPAEDVERIKIAPGDALEALLDAAMPAFEDLANEIRLSFDYVEGQFDQQVANVVLTGGTSQLVSIAEILGNVLGRPVQVFDPLAGIDLVSSRYDVHGLIDNSPSLTVALGLASHLIGDSRTGLGGKDNPGWQPRQQQRSGTNLPRGAQNAASSAAPAPAAATAIIPAGDHPGAQPPPMNRGNEPLAMPTPLPPPPAAFTPLTPPPSSGSAPIAMPHTTGKVKLPTTRETKPRSITEEIRAPSDENNASGLLVVLDDDQEVLPASGEHRKGTDASGRQNKGSGLKVESFDEDDEPGRTRMPDLPKL